VRDRAALRSSFPRRRLSAALSILLMANDGKTFMPYLFQYTKSQLDRLLGRLQAASYTSVAPLSVEAWRTPEPVPYAERTSGERLELSPGDKWGDLWDCAWFHFTGEVPASAAGRKVVLLIDVNGEACVVDANGDPALGLTNVNSEFDYSLGRPGKRVVPLADPAQGGERVDLWADAGTNDLFGKLRDGGTLKEAWIAVCNVETLALSYDWETLHELMRQLPEDSARRQRILFALYEASKVLRAFTEEEAEAARAILAPELAKKGGDPSLTVSAVGHAHIDLAWLWPIRETIRKGARTFSTVLAMMDRYPDYVFGASQPQIYQWMKDEYPNLYARIKEKVAEGRWEVQGGMWVEPDTNVPSGESLARQLLYGKRFFRREFGVETNNLWLPDVFGYSGALPQILKKSGVDYFLTQKLSWSLVNSHPHHSYFWQGIDGSRVLAHMPPEDTYNSPAAPRSFRKAEANYKDKAVSENCLVLFGIGDGGGGPGEEHLERLAREKNLSGLPPVIQEPAYRFFERLVKDADKFQTWAGELYLERHQGTYTTQGRNKRYNRKMEIALRELELSAVWAMQFGGAAYPAEALDRIWKEMLLYQFHDILPGSSITRVYDESLARYAVLLKEVEDLTAEADRRWAAALGSARPLILVNSLSWERSEWLKVGENWKRVTVPSLGIAALDEPSESDPVPPVLSTSESVLENDLLRIEFAEDGYLKSVFDKENGREVLMAGARGNVLAVYDDPGDAWDFPMDYDRRPPAEFALEASEAFLDGPRAVVRQTRKFGASTLTQEIAVTAGSRRVDFSTHVDWRESHKMLRASFPVAVRTDEATFEIQFGNLKRPTHRNTTWDMAKVEVCAQKWADLSERGYGVALLNDCKYGHQVEDGVLDLNLLRSPSSPDPVADRAEHDFVYALYPHAGDVAAGEVVRAGYELNVPIRIVRANPGGDASEPISWLRIDRDNVVLEAAKKAEDSGDFILRLYEAHGEATRATLDFGFRVEAASVTDLMEENPQEAEIRDGSVTLDFRPFDIHTLRVSV
jgi:alpha-mannosidase